MLSASWADIVVWTGPDRPIPFRFQIACFSRGIWIHELLKGRYRASLRIEAGKRYCSNRPHRGRILEFQMLPEFSEVISPRLFLMIGRWDCVALHGCLKVMKLSSNRPRFGIKVCHEAFEGSPPDACELRDEEVQNHLRLRSVSIRDSDGSRASGRFDQSRAGDVYSRTVMWVSGGNDRHRGL